MTDSFHTAEPCQTRHWMVSLGDPTGCISPVHPHLLPCATGLFLRPRTMSRVTPSCCPLASASHAGCWPPESKIQVVWTSNFYHPIFLPTFPVDPCEDQEQEDFTLGSSCGGVLDIRDTYQVIKQAWHTNCCECPHVQEWTMGLVSLPDRRNNWARVILYQRQLIHQSGHKGNTETKDFPKSFVNSCTHCRSLASTSVFTLA